MSNGDLNWIANFIWGIADDVLRDLYVRGKYRDVILPMTVLRRLDAVLEPTKQTVLDMKATLDKAGITNQDQALRQAAGQSFYNTSKFTLRDLRARASQQQLRADFEAYLDGYSPNVQEIFDNFEFRNQIPRLSKADALGTLIEKFLDPSINVSPNPVLNSDGSQKQPGLDNHAMGTIFEELVRRFNEENNEEAGEHWTPRDAVKLMANLIFLPIADQIESGTYLLYDGACGTGGMLTVGEETLQQLAKQHGKEVATHLYGQDINAETYAICKADLLLKGEGEAADNIVGGPEHSTLSNDAFPSREFDFMLSNPPYGKSWKSDLERMGGKEGIKDPRFIIEHAGDPLRKNLGKKNCELSDEDIQRICDTFLAFKETEQSKIFPNNTFGYWKVTVERPLRLHSQFTPKAIESLRFASGDEVLRSEIHDKIGEPIFEEFGSVRAKIENLLNAWREANSEDES
jgi:type I restriction enzyme M protein